MTPKNHEQRVHAIGVASGLLDYHDDTFLFSRNDTKGAWHVVNKRTRMFAVYYPPPDREAARHPRHVDELRPGLDATEAALVIAKHLGVGADEATEVSRFAIGDACWPGIAKLIEECGEVVQVCGKLMATQGERTHWDGSDLYRRLEDELADLRAVIRFVQTTNPALDMNRILDRTETKFATFMKWHLEQR